MLTARLVDAPEAKTLGLVDEVHPADALERRARELAAQIATFAPLTLAAAKEATRRILAALHREGRRGPPPLLLPERGLPGGRPGVPREAARGVEGPLTPCPPAAAPARPRPAGRRWTSGRGRGAGGRHRGARARARGVDVALLDRAPLPRDKTCGGGVVARALESLPPGVGDSRRAAARPGRVPLRGRGRRRDRRAGRRRSSTWPCGRRSTSRSPRPRAPRGRRSAPCARRASRARAGPRPARDEPRAVRARFLVAADGATGPTARAAGWTEPLSTVPALEAEVEVPPASSPASPTAPGSTSVPRPAATAGSSRRRTISRWASASSRGAARGGGSGTSSPATSTPSGSARRACCAFAGRPSRCGPDGTPPVAGSSSPAMPPASRIRSRARGSRSRS